MADFACIVVHYGTLSITRDCVVSLQSSFQPPLTVVVCNTGAGEAELLAAVLRREGVCCAFATAAPEADAGSSPVWILHTGANLGFARANNMGIRFALEIPGLRWLWLLNNDTRIEPDAPALLRNCLEGQGRAVVGTAVVRHDAPDLLELALGCRFSPVTSVITPALPGFPLAEAVREPAPQVDYVYGASFAVSTDVLREIGPLDGAYFLYYEELDFCARARRAGCVLRWCPEAVVLHGFGRCGRETRESRSFRHHHETLSTFLFLLRHHPWALVTALPLRTAAKLVLLPLRGEAWLLQSYFSGLAEFFRRVFFNQARARHDHRP